MSIQSEIYRIQSGVEDVAKALRLKKNGITTSYNLSGISSAVFEFPFANIPLYHTVEAGRVIKRILDLKEAHPNHIVFGTISDNHVNIDRDSTMRSARHAAFAIEAVGAMAGCDFVANLGDNVSGNDGVDSGNGRFNAIYMDEASRYAMKSQTAFNLVGNHDKSNSTQWLYDLIGQYNDFDVGAPTPIRGFGYKDFTDKKVRVISLNTCDYWNIMGGNGMSYEQKDFFMRALDLSSKSDYASWTIVVLSHIPLDFLGGDYNKSADLKAILKAYNDGTTASITVNSSYASAQDEQRDYSGTLTYNYSGKNAPRVINIHGHIHTNKYGKLKFIDDNTELDMIRIATPNSSYDGNASTDRYTEYGDYSITAEEAAKIKKIPDSKADTSATFYFIDLDGQVVYAVGYGADIDRTVPYKAVKVYSVTYSLTSVASSNSGTSIIEGESYQTTLSVGSGYAFGTVKVTMGGTDITASAYNSSTHKITIGSVTGNVVITATAIDNYTPHWDIADRTAITNVYETASQAHACVTSRHNYIYGISDTGAIDYRAISDVSLSGNDITFKSTTANINIGLPYQLEPGASYTFKATASLSARLRVATFDNTGKFVAGVGNSSSGTSLTYTFNATTTAGYWTVVMLDVRTGGNKTTFSNISLTKN